SKDILVVPIGFIADHVEVLFDLDVEAKEAADKAGVRMRRAGTVGDHPAFGRMMADVVLKRMRSAAAPEQTSSRSTLYEDGRRDVCAGKLSALCMCQPESRDPDCVRWAAAPTPARPSR